MIKIMGNAKKLTQMQSLLWTGQQLNPEAPLYNVVYAFHISGKLAIPYFQKAFQELVNKTDALRVVFHEIESVPFQSVLEEVQYSLEVLNFSSKSESKIQEWLNKRSQVLLDISVLPFDSVVIKVNGDNHIWYLNIHHMVTDATSSTLLYGNMIEIYERLISETLNEMEDIPSFSNYIEFEEKEKANQNTTEIQSYWAQKATNSTTLPSLYGRKNIKDSILAERVKIKLGHKRTNALRTLALRPEIRSWTPHLTLFNLFTTTLFSFLYRVSGQKQLTIGAPSHNRPTKSSKKTPGLFIEVFALQTMVEEDDTFLTLLNRIKLETNEYIRYALPGMSSVELNRSFNTAINYITAKFPDFDNISMQSDWMHTGYCDPGNLLYCNIYDMDASGEIEIYFDLNLEVFDDRLRSDISAHFLRILDGLIDDIEQPITKPSLVKKTEVLDSAANYEVSEGGFISIIAQFEQHVKATPSATAIREKDEIHTYEALNQKANQLAHELIRRKIKVGDRVALYMERSPEYIIGVLAILKIGATFIPIPSNQAVQRVSYILKDSNCALILTTQKLRQILNSSPIETISLDGEHKIFENQFIDNTDINSKSNDIAYMIYTSGTTGNPKGALISHAGIFNYMNWAIDTYIIDKAVYPLFTSIGFDVTISSMFSPLLSGGELHIYREASHGPNFSLMKVLDDNRVNGIKVTPSHIGLLQDMDLSDSYLHTIIVGGEDFKTKVAESIPKIFGKQLRIFNEYGPTEATIGCIASQYTAEKHSETTSVPIGTPIDNMEIYLLDSYGNHIPEGVVGELYLSGIGLGDGYANLAALTSEKFIDNPFVENTKMYRTGDLARLNENGEYEYLGRIDEQIKLGGHRIELNDIEANLLKFEGIENACIVLIEGEKINQDQKSGYSKFEESKSDQKYLIGYYTGEKKVNSKELERHLKNELPQYMVPAHFRFIEELPLTSNGKVDKTTLKALSKSQLDTDAPYVAPKGDIEKLLASIWKEVLVLEQVGVMDDFISLGGHSLTAIRITTRINENLELNLPLNKIFELPTIVEYSKFIEDTLVKLLGE